MLHSHAVFTCCPQVYDVEGPKLKYALTRKRIFFGQGGKFHDADHIEAEDFKPYRDPQFKENLDMGPGVYGTRMLQIDKEVQCVPAQSHATSQTARFRMVNSMVQYAPIMVEAKTSKDAGTGEDALTALTSLKDMLDRMAPLAEVGMIAWCCLQRVLSCGSGLLVCMRRSLCRCVG